jgi:hypothetical protein
MSGPSWLTKVKALFSSAERANHAAMLGIGAALASVAPLLPASDAVARTDKAEPSDTNGSIPYSEMFVLVPPPLPADTDSIVVRCDTFRVGTNGTLIPLHAAGGNATGVTPRPGSQPGRTTPQPRVSRPAPSTTPRGHYSHSSHSSHSSHRSHRSGGWV